MSFEVLILRTWKNALKILFKLCFLTLLKLVYLTGLDNVNQ